MLNCNKFKNLNDALKGFAEYKRNTIEMCGGELPVDLSFGAWLYMEDDTDAVNHPKHYKLADGRDLLDLFWEYSEGGAIYFCVFNAAKYGFRSGKKDIAPEDEDKRKMDFYVKNCAEHSGFSIEQIQHFVDHFIATANSAKPKFIPDEITEV